MGRGGYIGAGTIIGPHTPEWFGRGGADEPDADPTATKPKSETDKRAFPEPGTQKTTRHQRRKRAKARHQTSRPVTHGPVTGPARKPLTEAAEQRIGKLRVHIKGLEQQIAACQQALDSSRTELNAVLREHGLPLDKPAT